MQKQPEELPIRLAAEHKNSSAATKKTSKSDIGIDEFVTRLEAQLGSANSTATKYSRTDIRMAQVRAVETPKSNDDQSSQDSLSDELPIRLARSSQPVRYAAQIPFGYHRLSETPAAILAKYHETHEHGLLGVLGDAIHDYDPHLSHIGHLLIRASQLPFSGRHESHQLGWINGVTAAPHELEEVAKPGMEDSTGWVAALHLGNPDGRGTVLHVPATRQELLDLHAKRTDLQQVNPTHYRNVKAQLERANQDRFVMYRHPEFAGSHLEDQQRLINRYRPQEDPTRLARRDEYELPIRLSRQDEESFDYPIDPREPAGWISADGDWHPNVTEAGHAATARKLGFTGRDPIAAAWDAGFTHVGTFRGELHGYHPRGEYSGMTLEAMKKIARKIGLKVSVNKVIGGQRREVPIKLDRDADSLHYAKTKKRLVVHPLLKGTRLAIALKQLHAGAAKSEASRGLAKSALLDPTQPAIFHALGDALAEEGHPLSESYNWSAIQRKLHLDSHILDSLKKVSQSRFRELNRLNIPMRNITSRDIASNFLLDALDNGDERRGVQDTTDPQYILGLDGSSHSNPAAWQLMHESARQFDPDVAAGELRQSLLRLHHRLKTIATAPGPARDFRRTLAKREAMRNADRNVENYNDIHGTEPPASQFEEKYRDIRREQERALHYAKGTPSVGGVKNALRILRSANQQRTRDIAARIMAKLGISRVKLRDAVTTSASPVASVAAAIYHDGDLEAVNRAAAYLGHLTQLPTVTAFHVAADGKDHLYKMTLPLDPVKAAQLIDSHGISRAVLTPSQNGTDAIILDPQGFQQDRVAAAAANAGVTEIQHSIGTAVSLGSDVNQPKANAAARKSYRNYINS